MSQPAESPESRGIPAVEHQRISLGIAQWFGFVWKCWVNIPNEIAIFHRDNDQQNHWVQWGTLFSDTPIWDENMELEVLLGNES